jgi:hypothetical protein
LSRYLGPSHEVGDAMCSKVLNSKGNVLVRSSVFPMLPDDTNSELVKQQISEFDESLQRSLGDRGAGIEIEYGGRIRNSRLHSLCRRYKW